MKLFEIIEENAKGKSSISTELLHPYRKSLYTYYKDYFNQEPVLMVTDVFNACSYALIVPANELHEAIEIYTDDVSLEEKECETECILANSMMLRDWL